ncbi:unnamed protein product [Protopolystoma xenopodis]|uniref:PDZ domain-containing protein n=1 Tax=Protopolystoma xenopodis TaxID=117903 RepID=A0A448WV82_9PLAT|nr:unnamed protein product [Protopolystoma xenopodis]
MRHGLLFYLQLRKGDILLSVNGRSLIGLQHGDAVELLRNATTNQNRVEITVLAGSETSLGAANFLPSWNYWLQVPIELVGTIAKQVLLRRRGLACVHLRDTRQTLRANEEDVPVRFIENGVEPLGFSIVGGCADFLQIVIKCRLFLYPQDAVCENMNLQKP